MDRPTDEELLGDYRTSHDLKVLGTLFDRYLELVYGLCLRYLGQDASAQDAVMGIFEALINKAAAHEVREFRPWLYVLARNYCLMELRRLKRKPEESIDPADMQSLDLEHPDDEGRDKEERLAVLNECMDSLNAEQKDCVSRFYLAGMSYKEIAEEKDLPLGKVRSHIQNGRRMLKLCVESREKAAN